jgi:hypothetical protein
LSYQLEIGEKERHAIPRLPFPGDRVSTFGLAPFAFASLTLASLARSTLGVATGTEQSALPTEGRRVLADVVLQWFALDRTGHFSEIFTGRYGIITIH